MLRFTSSTRRATTRRHYKDTSWESGQWYPGAIYLSAVDVIAMCESGTSRQGQLHAHSSNIALTLSIGTHNSRFEDTLPPCAASRCLMRIQPSQDHETQRFGYGTSKRAFANTCSSGTRQASAASRYMAILSCQGPTTPPPRYGVSVRASACAH